MLIGGNDFTYALMQQSSTEKRVLDYIASTATDKEFSEMLNLRIKIAEIWSKIEPGMNFLISDGYDDFRCSVVRVDVHERIIYAVDHSYENSSGKSKPIVINDIRCMEFYEDKNLEKVVVDVKELIKQQS